MKLGATVAKRDDPDAFAAHTRQLETPGRAYSAGSASDTAGSNSCSWQMIAPSLPS
jgi:hypothetical protein